MSMFPSSEAAWLSCFWFISHLFTAHSATHVSPLWFFQVWFNKPYAMHCVKRVRIRSYSGPHFSAFGLNTERHRVRIQSKCREMWTKITPNTDAFHAVSSVISHVNLLYRVIYPSVIYHRLCQKKSKKRVEGGIEDMLFWKNLWNF